MVRYRSTRQEASVEQLIEKSRFIAHIKPVDSKEDAQDFFEGIRALHKAATHNVPAYVIGEKSNLQWASDDGEPQGTSGAPIVQMLVKENITNTAIIVTRYFGGIKLGTGGLVRAYTGVSKLALEKAGICEVREVDTLTVKIDYCHLGRLKNMADGTVFSLGNVVYQEKIIVDILMEPEKNPEVFSLISNLTGGDFEEVGMRRELIKF